MSRLVLTYDDVKIASDIPLDCVSKFNISNKYDIKMYDEFIIENPNGEQIDIKKIDNHREGYDNYLKYIIKRNREILKGIKMANIRHTVVIRKDLNMTEGLMSAQVAHAQDAFMRHKIRDEEQFTNDEKYWMKDPYLSVLAVDNLEELEIIQKEAEEAELTVHVWRDLIPSKNLRRNIPDVTVAISIGPCDMDRVKAITGNLPLA